MRPAFDTQSLGRSSAPREAGRRGGAARPRALRLRGGRGRHPRVAVAVNRRSCRHASRGAFWLAPALAGGHSGGTVRDSHPLSSTRDVFFCWLAIVPRNPTPPPLAFRTGEQVSCRAAIYCLGPRISWRDRSGSSCRSWRRRGSGAPCCWGRWSARNASFGSSWPSACWNAWPCRYARS